MVMAKNKIMSAEQAVSYIQNGDSIMVGGFGLRGCPHELENVLAASGKKDLTIISVSCDSPGMGLGLLLRNGQIKKIIGSFFNSNREVAAARNAGKLEVDMLPMGNFAEAIRAGGMGIPAFYTPVGAGTELGGAREIREFDGRLHMLQPALKARIALIRAKKADALGNLIYSKTARNFNPDMAAAADYTIALVDEIVEPGELDPDSIMTSHIYVDALVRAEVGNA